MLHFTKRIITWSEVSSMVTKIIPELTPDAYKGQMGRVAVIGGSVDYTGAPYYSAQASLKFGADLAFVFCSDESAIPIKSYSPELMVVPFYGTTPELKSVQFTGRVGLLIDTLPRIHSLVVGPGMGRNSELFSTVRNIVLEAMKLNLGVVIDADGLFMLQQDPSLVFNYKRCILSPNRAEFDRLVKSVQHWYSSTLPPTAGEEGRATATVQHVLRHKDWVLAALSRADEKAEQVHALSVALGGVAVLLKGSEDMLCAGGDVYVLSERGSPRRCGGQGDILSGALAVALHWAVTHVGELPSISGAIADNEELVGFGSDVNAQLNVKVVYAALLASVVTKRASEAAFAVHGRSMTSPDVIACLGQAFKSISPIG